MTHTAGDGSIYHQSNSGTGFGSAVGDNMNWRTDSPVTMASTPTRLWRVVRGTDNKIYTSGHAGSYRFGGEEIKNWPTPHGPALAYHANRLWLFLRGTDGFMKAATHASSWSGLQDVSGPQSNRLASEPAAASHNGKLYVMYSRPAP
ncbi:hypothetical protein OHB12_08015 [Nocardia sp. NBC_01730]|uniref:hypothetical protein n=1 Tax=Nocardia sp. NBC_01730 TaxID=2975998 RepID=UPI002E14B4F9|nr:hypothetical protein OHB12_08015 [Nocardia sp. NBC_01730]